MKSSNSAVPRVPPGKLLHPHNLREYQRRSIAFLERAPCAALFLDMGLGKTISALSMVKRLLVQGTMHCALVVAPLRVVKGVWRQEGKKWSHTRDLVFSVVHGGAKARKAALETPAHVYLINPEGLVWLIEMMNRLELQEDGKWPFDVLIVDESSMFKDSHTKRFKALRKVLHLFKRRIIMTGTPTPNSMLELWAQFYLLDMGDRLGSVYFRFRERYFERADFMGYHYRLRRGADRLLNSVVKDVVLRLDAADWLQLPPTLYNHVRVDMPEEVMAQYNEFENSMFLELLTADVEAISAASLSGRCHQIANGALYGDDRETGHRVWEPMHDEKLKALREIVDEAGSPVLVAYQYRHDLERLRAAYPRAPVLGEGDSTVHEREWNAGMHPVMLVHPKSAGHGLNLQDGGHTVAFFSLTWSLEQHDQLIARVGAARQAQAGRSVHPVIVHYIITNDTVDEAIMDAIESKAHGQRSLLNALKEYKDAKTH